MKFTVLIGTYRHDPEMLYRCVNSLKRYMWPLVEKVIFIDDSGDPEFLEHLHRFYVMDFAGFYQVATTRKNAGFNKAMALTCQVMKELDEQYVVWWEEDFEAITDIDLRMYSDELAGDLSLCQMTFLRQPWFEVEKKDGIVKALEDRTGEKVHMVGGVHTVYYKSQAQFSTNPGIWTKKAWLHGWPQCHGSEDAKTSYLVLDDDLHFGLTARQLVHHEGERVGHGY